MSPGLGEAIGLLLAWPFMVLADWFAWIKRQPAGQQELTKACHGIGMLALLGYWFSLTGGLGEFVHALRMDADNPLNWLPVVIASWGLGWFLLNARFAAQFVIGPQRATMIVRALIKIALGYAVWVYAGDAGSADRGPSLRCAASPSGAWRPAARSFC
jgi:hypothetical protein